MDGSMDIYVAVVAGCICVAMVPIVLGCLRCRKRPSQVEIQRQQLQKFRKRRMLQSDRILTNRVDYVRPVVEYSESYLSPMNPKHQMMLWSPPATKLSVSDCVSPKEHSFFDNSFQTVIEVSSVMAQHSPDRTNQMVTTASHLTSYLGVHDNSSVSTSQLTSYLGVHDNSSSVSTAPSSYKDNLSDTTEGKSTLASDITESTELTDVILTIDEPAVTPAADDITESTELTDVILTIDESTVTPAADDLVADGITADDIIANNLSADDQTADSITDSMETDAFETDNVQLTLDDLQPCIRVRSDSLVSLVIDVRRRTNSESRRGLDSPLRRASKRRLTIPIVNTNSSPGRDMRRGFQNKTTRDVSLNISGAEHSLGSITSMPGFKNGRKPNHGDTFNEASFTHTDAIRDTTVLKEYLENIECSASFCDETEVKQYTAKQGNETLQGGSSHASNSYFHGDSTNRNFYERLTPRSHEENVYQSLKSLTLPRIHKQASTSSKHGSKLRSRHLSDFSGGLSEEDFVELRKTEAVKSAKPYDIESHKQYGGESKVGTGKEQNISEIGLSFCKASDVDYSRFDHQSDSNTSCEENDYESLSFGSEDTPSHDSQDIQADIPKNNLDHTVSDIKVIEDKNRRYSVPDHTISDIKVTEDKNRRFSIPDHTISDIKVTEDKNRRYSIPNRCRHSSLSHSFTKHGKDSEERYGSYPSAKKLALKSAFKHAASPRFSAIQNNSKNYDNSRVGDLNSSLRSRDPKGSLSFNGDSSYMLSSQYIGINELKPLPMEMDTSIISGYKETFGSISPMNTYQTMKACTNLKTNGSLRKCPMAPLQYNRIVPPLVSPGQWNGHGRTHSNQKIFTTTSPFVMACSQDSDYFRF